MNGDDAINQDSALTKEQARIILEALNALFQNQQAQFNELIATIDRDSDAWNASNTPRRVIKLNPPPERQRHHRTQSDHFPSPHHQPRTFGSKIRGCDGNEPDDGFSLD